MPFNPERGVITVTDAIDKDAYYAEVDQLAEYIHSDATGSVVEGPHDTFTEAVHEFVEEDVTHANWFARDYYGASLYGSIIEHSVADVTKYGDWEHLVEGATPAKAAERIAQACMEADVTKRVFELHDE